MDEEVLAKAAIEAALDCNWEEAVAINLAILEKTPEDTEALNRLARAYCELDQIAKTIECYNLVLKIDPSNSIANKNLKLLTKSKNGLNGKNGVNGKNGNKRNSSLEIFLSEPGRTKLVNLVNLATPTTLSTLTCGEKTELVVKRHQVIVESQNGEYLGAVPDDLSHYLISLTRAGNSYEAYIKAIKTNLLTVIICETGRCPKFANQPSFLTKRRTKLPKASETEISEAELGESPLESSEV